MANNRRTFKNSKLPKPIPCETCLNLQYTPTFLESLTNVRKLNTAQEGTAWYHSNGHAVFVR